MTVPLKLRITLAFAAGMALILAALGMFVYARTGADLLEQVDAGIRSRAEVLAGQIARQGPHLSEPMASLIERDEAFAQVADRSGRILQSSPIVGDAPLLDQGAIASLAGPRFFDRTIPGIDDVTRVLAVPVPSGGRMLVLMVGSSLQDRRDEMLQLAATLAVAVPAALAMISLGGWLLVGAALRPVERIRRDAASVSAFEPNRQLPTPRGNDELARLASTLNAMLSRLAGAFERERRFVDDASHELRTPLAVLRGTLEVSLSQPRTSQELESGLRLALTQAEHLSRLADDLLVLSRTRDGKVPIHREEVHLAELVERSVASLGGRARGAGVRLEVDVDGGRGRLDPVRVRQVVENLLDNSLRHTPPGGWVRLSARAEGGVVRVEVQDSGSGFPEDLLPAAFDPFIRGAADRSEPGAGLGLAIVRAVAEAHGGAVFGENPPQGGARVTVTLGA